MDGMLQKDPAKRMSIRELLASDCMQQALELFASTVTRNSRLAEATREFVREGIMEARETLTAHASPSFPSFEGVVGKLRDGRFVDRYLVLRGGFLGIFRDRQSAEGVVLTTSNSKPVSAVAHVARVPNSGGSNVIDIVFVLDFVGNSSKNNNCVWLRSDNCDGWVSAIRAALKL